MAIVVSSPQKHQNTFVWVVAAVLIAGVVMIFLIVFPPPFLSDFTFLTPSSPETSSQLQNTNIDFSVLDSPQVKALQLFSQIQASYSYTAQDTAGKPVSGTVTASSSASAYSALMAEGLQKIIVQPVTVGRVEPFVNYQSATPASAP